MRLDQIHGLPDGTYQLSRVTGKVEDYAAKWAYGYIVGIGTLDRDPQYGELFGVWYDEDNGVQYVDRVTHLADANAAADLARKNGELAVYDLRDKAVRYVTDESPKDWFTTEPVGNPH